nr:SEC-C metal-binding domain-containing protein [Fredinandcohnia onubensis]
MCIQKSHGDLVPPDLKKAIQERMKPANPYDPCPCNSGKKYKFFCSKNSFDLDI